MCAVIMGYEGRSHPDKPHKEKGHVKQLQEAVNALHDADYVHCGLQEPNILITTGSLKLIDFDWCEKEGAARYLLTYPWPLVSGGMTECIVGV